MKGRIELLIGIRCDVCDEGLKTRMPEYDILNDDRSVFIEPHRCDLKKLQQLVKENGGDQEEQDAFLTELRNRAGI